MNLVDLRKSFGSCSPEEITAGCHAVRPSVDSYEKAQLWLWKIIQGLLDNNRYRDAAHILWGPNLFDARPKSVSRILDSVENNAKVIILGGAAQGKSLKKGTKVLLANGQSIRVEDVTIGDYLAGPSGKRLVTNRSNGQEEMFEITPKIGEPFECTKDHILTLKCSCDKLCGSGSVSSFYKKGNIIDIRLDDYLEKSKTFKRHWKLFRSGWDMPAFPVMFDPYIYGCWLGDGTVGVPALTNMDCSILQIWRSYFESMGYRIHEEKKERASAVFARTESGKENPFRQFIRSSFINGEKRILRSYLQNSREVRMRLLAGLMDTDGHVGKSNVTGFETITKYSGLAEDIRYLAHSLGFYCSKRLEKKGIKSTGFVGQYWRIRISGRCYEVPTLVKRAKKSILQDVTCSSFKVKSIGTGDYCGFTLDGDGRFILESGWVTHNSYTIIAYLILDWLRDPEYTGARIISTTASHAIEITFSSLQRFYTEALLPLPGIQQQGFIGLDTQDRHASLSVIAIKQGETGSSSLQGFHPIRRQVPHPKFGGLSRIRLFLDESELIPHSVWKGVGNLLSNLRGKETVKVICATNPWDVTSILAANAEPVNGHSKVDIDQDKEWVSKLGWKTLRLDPADSENVKEKKEVYEGLMTYEGFEQYRSKTNGQDPEYLCFGRGIYPTHGSIEQLIPLSYLDDWIGTWIFDSGTVVGCGGCDLAFEGDDVIFFAGRYGKSSQWMTSSGEIIKLEEPRYVVQADQFRTLQKMKTEAQYTQIRKTADEFGISYNWLALDKTGVGTGVSDLFYERGHRNMMAIGWGQRATHTKILDEDRHHADELYDGIAAEMYFALRHWLEFGFIKASKHIDMTKLQKEIIGRKQKPAGLGHTGEKKYALEQKKEFKKRYPFSPDRADALVMMLHVARIRGPQRAHMEKKRRQDTPINLSTDEVSNVTYIDFSRSGGDSEKSA